MCIFCGRNANSKEHFWPTWLHPLIVKPDPEQRHSRQSIKFHPSTGERVTGPENRQGGVHTIRIRAVCTDCNSGWMNRLEADARPIVTALATAGTIIMGEPELYTLAKWITLKCLVAEWAAPETAMTPQSYRTTFMDSGAIPDFFRIYVTLNVSGSELGYIRHSHCAALSMDGPVPPLDGTTQNVQTLSFLLGKAFVHVNAIRLDGFELETKAIIPLVWNNARVWPLQHVPMVWPRRPALERNGIKMVSECLESYIQASKPIWAGSA